MLNNDPKYCKHEWEMVWLSENLEGYRCKNCNYESLDASCWIDRDCKKFCNGCEGIYNDDNLCER